MSENIFIRRKLKANTIIIFACLLSSFSIHAEIDKDLEKVLNKLIELETYCDSGRYFDYRGPQGTFERCFRKDGAYKQVVYFDGHWKRREVNWSDGKVEYSFTGNIENDVLTTKSYEEKPVRQKERNAGYLLPDLILKVLNVGVLNYSNNTFHSYLDKYQTNNTLSNPDTLVLDYERPFPNGITTENNRIWISIADSIVIKTAKYSHSEQRSYVEVSDYRLNIKLNEGELLPSSDVYEVINETKQEKKKLTEKLEVLSGCIRKNQELENTSSIKNNADLIAKCSGSTPNISGVPYESPKKVWQAYQNFLKAGDAENAIKCLMAKARRDFMPILTEMSREELEELANVPERLVMTYESQPISTGYLHTENGIAGSIRFSYVGGSWRISSM